MVRSLLIRILLIPISLLYGIGVSINNLLYRSEILKPFRFSLPIISVGNLTVGGSGKTPHTEYLIRLLNPHISLATMSRGYGRKTKGFLIARENFSAYEIGDEPLQYARKFDGIVVSVAENRGMGVPKLLSQHPEIETILLDDAFQHRSIEPGLNILLTEYAKPYYKDFLMPSGRLREWASGARRADAVVVSKCPEDISSEQMEQIEKKLKLEKHQELFFSYYKYLRPYNIFNPSQAVNLSDFDSVFLVSAIANTDYLMAYLEEQHLDVYDLSFEDHHRFSNYEISNIIHRFQEQSGERKILLTTEKDAMRLELHKGYFLEKDTQVFALPIVVRFHPYQRSFDDYIKDYLLNVKV